MMIYGGISSEFINKLLIQIAFGTDTKMMNN